MGTVSEGATGIDYEEVCPVCGREGKDRNQYCMQQANIIECPNGNECKNTEDNGYRIGCTGYLSGYIGMGPYLGSNILTATYGIPRLEPRDDDFRNKIRSGYVRKIRRLNQEIIARFKEEGMDSATIEQREQSFKKEVSEIYKKGSHTLYDYNTHPLYIGSGSIQAHHLICSEAVKTVQWKAICKKTGYNINCKLNGVFLPSDMKLACYTGLQCHRGGHSLGRGDLGKSYVKHVKLELKKTLLEIKKNNNNKCKGDESLKIITDLNNFSSRLVNNIKLFTWTIAADSLNYNTGGIGCADCDSITAKRKKLKEIISNDQNNQLRSLFRKNKESITLKQIDNIELKSMLKSALADGMCSQREAGETPPHNEEFVQLYGEEKCRKIKEYELKKAH